MSLTHPLLELAASRRAGDRLALLRSTVDMLFEGGSGGTAAEAVLFEEIATEVLGDLDADHRAAFSDRLADYRAAPRRLALLLAVDDITVARPVLERYPSFSDQDLIGLASRSGDEHLCAISRRPSLAAVVTDVLVGRGSELVLRLLAANDGAMLSSGGVEQLVQRTVGDEAAQESLARRRDLPAPALISLSSLLTASLKARLLASGHADPDSLAPGLATHLRETLETAVQERADEMEMLARLMEEIRAGGVDLRRVVRTLARADRTFDLAVLASSLAQVDRATAADALVGAAEEPLVVLFKAMDVPWDAFESVLQMRARRDHRPYVPNPRLALAYAEMERSTARRVLGFLASRRGREAELAMAN